MKVFPEEPTSRHMLANLQQAPKSHRKGTAPSPHPHRAMHALSLEHVTFPPIIIVLGTKDLDGSLLMPERTGHNATEVKINWTEFIACIRGGLGPQPTSH